MQAAAKGCIPPIPPDIAPFYQHHDEPCRSNIVQCHYFLSISYHCFLICYCYNSIKYFECIYICIYIYIPHHSMQITRVEVALSLKARLSCVTERDITVHCYLTKGPL